VGRHSLGGAAEVERVEGQGRLGRTHQRGRTRAAIDLDRDTGVAIWRDRDTGHERRSAWSSEGQ